MMSSSGAAASGPDQKQQRSVRVDEAFAAACHNTGITLRELDAKTLDDFRDGPHPSASATSSPRNNNGASASDDGQQAPAPSGGSNRGPAIPKDILARRHRNYEALRLRKLHLVLQERDRLISKGQFTADGERSQQQRGGNSGGEPTPRTPGASFAPASSLAAAPPPNVPRPPPASARRASLQQSGRAANHTPSAPPTPRGGGQMEPLDFGEGDRVSAQQQSVGSSRRGSASTSQRPRQSPRGTTPRLPPVDGASTPDAARSNGMLTTTHGNNNNNNASLSAPAAYASRNQRDLLLEAAHRQHRQRTLTAQRTANAALLKEAKGEDQQRRAAEVRLREAEEAAEREQRARLIHAANLQQADNRARRDEELRQMRADAERANREMAELEAAAKAREVAEVRARQQELTEAKAEAARRRNDAAMGGAKERQREAAERYEADLERKGLLCSLSSTSVSISYGASSNFNGTTASGGAAGNGTAAAIGESEMRRRLIREAEQRRFDEKRNREAQRMAAATDIAEQARLRALLTIQQKELRSREHQSKEDAARREYNHANEEAATANAAYAREHRARAEEELRLYREQLDAERAETQEERDRRVFMEQQLRTEDRMARDEWRRSVAERARRSELVRQNDAALRVAEKQHAAEQRRREMRETIAAINAGAFDGDEGDDFAYDDGTGGFDNDGHGGSYNGRESEAEPAMIE